MNSYKLFEAEYRMMSIIWESEPLSSTALVKLCAERLGWKKSTTYTQLKRLSERGFIENRDTVVVSLIKKEQVERYDSNEIVNGRFDGSLPKFLTAFLDSKPLSAGELDELRGIIERYRRDSDGSK